MKKSYRSPKLKAMAISSDALLSGSWPKDDTGGVNPTPGGQGNFSANSRFNFDEDEDATMSW